MTHPDTLDTKHALEGFSPSGKFTQSGDSALSSTLTGRKYLMMLGTAKLPHAAPVAKTMPSIVTQHVSQHVFKPYPGTCPVSSAFSENFSTKEQEGRPYPIALKGGVST